ncbi:hypothetical protein CSUB01_00763 [Colletotrichum sublineola]|uniref:Uncharacterized protein n=1 Tax=Colletotrichum sublineola TaxID=1173701 RepID=A0A066WXJ9_COLSU|nr:hypothetical protein CSUB01_00763 [Colletotrichum sublineola]
MASGAGGQALVSLACMPKRACLPPSPPQTVGAWAESITSIPDLRPFGIWTGLLSAHTLQPHPAHHPPAGSVTYLRLKSPGESIFLTQRGAASWSCDCIPDVEYLLQTMPRKSVQANPATN